MSVFRIRNPNLRIELGLDYFSFNKVLKFEVLEGRRENFYAYYRSLVVSPTETALDYLKLYKVPVQRWYTKPVRLWAVWGSL